MSRRGNWGVSIPLKPMAMSQEQLKALLQTAYNAGLCGVRTFEEWFSEQFPPGAGAAGRTGGRSVTDEEKLERRVRLAKAAGTLFPESYLPNHLPHERAPDYDTDPAARERLLEWFVKQGYFISLDWSTQTNEWMIEVSQVGNLHNEWHGYHAEYAESLLSAIDAALLAREKAWIDSTHYEGNYK